MTKLTLLVPVLAVLAVLSACGEKPQTLGSNKNHVSPYEGAKNEFVAPGWNVGDKSSWEQGLKARTWNTQNEYSKIN